ncbi:putative cation chloride protein [Botrytis fragariae]|uniref:Putative cation chloride protein n=1 Tax=Botrytis fragariae TaxID=1964551 RepID=A0A8H6EGU7_9HELO|nr:putative cation chloride protein [Botrytis fragariae]KAF5871683.1 putative cation chloride protein [Botrytis fragariae]
MPNAGQGIDSIGESSTSKHGTQCEGEAPASESNIGNGNSLTHQMLDRFSSDVTNNDQPPDPQEEQQQDPYSAGTMGENSLTGQIHNEAERKKNGTAISRSGLGPRPIGGQEKLGMFSGVYVPTCLNVLSILMFLRFGFILGQSGLLGMIGMLVASYVINFITTFSLSAIASNGTVRGGGAYYLISRSLGPEFGGSIGLVFYLGFVFNTGMNAVGLIDCITLNFGADHGNWAHILPETNWYCYLWSTVILVLCTLLCLAGSGIFARASNGLLVILFIATLSIPLSTLVVSPFESRSLGIEYTGISLQTLSGNLLPQLTKGAAGSQINGRETFQDLFGILFPATGGIFAGASMSGDLRSPSKAIPKGTVYGLITTFCLYTLVIVAMAATVTRSSFLRNTNVLQETNMSGLLILAGEVSTSLFSVLMGIIGSAKLLQAISRDSLLPGFAIFSQGTKKADEPTFAIIFTFIVTQFTMLGDLNQIASFVTMTYLMTFLVMNLACFLLSIGSAPNWRPSFHFFNWQTAFAGAILSGVAMFFVDGVYATGCVGMLLLLFLLIHYSVEPKSWGDVSQSLIYHQIRKYLLKLKQEHVKFWRPQVILLVNDPRRQYKLIQFCNSMKKGGLYILGHIIVTDDFSQSVPEARRQQAAWNKYIDFSKIKAFVNIAISPALEWGARNIILNAGLGGMRPNIAVMGFYNLDDLRTAQPLIDISEPSEPSSGNVNKLKTPPRYRRQNSREKKMQGVLPTDLCRTEGMMSVTSYVTILEDLLFKLQINVAVAKGFRDLELPDTENTKKYIDLWPIQMSAEIAAEGDVKQNVLTTNFDTYTLILQLGVILNTVPAWKKAYKLRVAVFVEYENDVEEERGRVKSLLENLRIEAEILVFWLASGDIPSYEIIINGATPGSNQVDEVEQCLKGQDWWDDIQKLRGNHGATTSAAVDLAQITNIFHAAPTWPDASFQQGARYNNAERFLGLRRLLRKSKKRQNMSNLKGLGVSMGMRSQRLEPDVMSRHASQGSASEDSDSDSELQTEEPESDDESAASEGDLDDFESDSDTHAGDLKPIARRRSHGDSLRGPPISKRAAGAEEPIPPTISKSTRQSIIDTFNKSPDVSIPTASAPVSPPRSLQPSGLQPPPVLDFPDSVQSLKDSQKSPAAPDSSASSSLLQPRNLGKRPPISRHTSTPKFSSKPVPMTRVATEDGPGPSIMFAETPSPPTARKSAPRMPSAYRSSPSFDRISEASNSSNPTRNPPSPTRSSYSLQSIPLSFNDLPCRAQHLILNQLIKSQSEETAVIFTTLPSPVEGTGGSREASEGYLGDLEVLCGGLPPVLLVHSNSMTVTVSL